jgi:hypothetical protein
VSDPNTEAREPYEIVRSALNDLYRTTGPAWYRDSAYKDGLAALEQAERALGQKDAALQALAALEDEFDGEGFASTEQRFVWAMMRVREALAAVHD